MEYRDFIKSKIDRIEQSGFDIDNDHINPALFDFQKFIVARALKAGKYAIFSDTGTGKTIMQLEFADQVVRHTDRPVIILTPLAVAGQTIAEGERFGYTVSRYAGQIDPGIYVTNYEQLDNIDVSIFSGVILDESSILKNFAGKRRNQIIDLFKRTEYKLACTATPSPNDPMELGNHSEFLNVMSRNEMLAMYFIHDGGDTSKWRLKKHSVRIFYEWVSTWAVMMVKPSDVGFNDDKYQLPALNLIEKQIITDKVDNGMLFNYMAVSATNFNEELRRTMDDRISIAAEIVNESDESFIVWVKHNEESSRLASMIPGSVEVKGSDSPEYKESKLLGFGRGEFRVLITKTKIAQFGLNYQNCHNQIFASLDFSFESLYQAIRRSYRFGQKSAVNIYLITTDTMDNVIKAIEDKKRMFNRMQQEMTNAMKNNISDRLQIGESHSDNEYFSDDEFSIIRGDCVIMTQKYIRDESIHFTIFSPPFAELYTYSDLVEDMGNSKDYAEFFTQFNYLIDELYRVMIPGRLVAVHCMDLPIKKQAEGFIGLRDFSGMLIQNFTDRGFIYHDRVTIWKDPVVEMQRTKALGLLHKQLKKDSSMSRTGIPDYLLVFRKAGNNPEPIENKNIPVDLWQKYASPVWSDINYSRTLQYMSARDNNDEKHIAPLQLDTIERAIILWSNPGDLVFSPFMGIGSEGYQAIELGRRFIGTELKHSYFEVAKKNLISASELKNQITLKLG